MSQPQPGIPILAFGRNSAQWTVHRGTVVDFAPLTRADPSGRGSPPR
jgi:hypothetical protein